MSALASQGSGSGCTVADYGFVYGTGASPALNDAGTAAASGYTKVSIGDSYDAGTLSKAITGLTAGTQYYYKAYAVNCKGKVEANVLNFRTKVKVSYNKNTTDAVTGDVPADTEIDYDGSHTISSNVLSRTGYDFLGWAESSSATVAQTGTVSNITANKTFYAVWRQKTYDVEWYVNGSLWGGAAVNYNHGASLALPASTPTSSDCDGEKVFVGWTATAGYSNATTAPGDLFTVASGTVTEPKKYYAVFANAAIGTQYTQITATSALEAGGRYLIVGNSSSTYKALPVDAATSLITVTPASSKISSPVASLVWTLEGSTNAWKIKSVSNGKYLQISGGNLTFESSTSLTFSVSVSSSKFTFTSSASSGNKVLSYYASGSKFNAYTSANNVYLYKANATYSNYSTTCSTEPDISVSTTSLSGFGYIVGQPVANSTVKNFTVSGRYLTNNIVVSIASDGDYEISESENSGYTNSITLTKNGSGAVSGTKIYVRLKAGNSVGDYNGSNQISVVSSPATTKNVSLSGAVTAKTLTGIAIQTAPTKTDYVIGEYFDPAGLVITATYNSGDETVTYAGNESNFTFTPSLTTTLEGSQTQVQITYGSQSVNQSITMNCPVTWSVNGTPLAAGAYSVVAYGAAVSTLPTNPVSNDCDGAKVFVGWTDTPIDGETDTKPATLYTTAASPWPNLNNSATYYAVFATLNGTETYSFTINSTDLTTTSYAANDGSHNVTATCTADPGKTMTVAYTTSNVMQSSSKLQFKSSSGILYNTTKLGSINSVTLAATPSNLNTFYGTTEQPTSGSLGSGQDYFTVKATSSTGTVSSITVNYTVNAYSAYVTNCNATRYSVTWKNNGVTMEDHGGSTEVVENSRITTIPTTKPTGCGTKEFVGWTDEPIVGVSAGRPAKLYEKPADFPTATGDVTYHAVFADVEGGEDIMFSFPDDNNASNGRGNYTSTWTATCGTNSLSITNLSNNSWNGSWKWIRAGRNGYTSVGTITTSAPIPHKVKSVDVYFGKITSSKVNSIKVYTSLSTDFSGDAGVGVSLNTGWQTNNIASPAANKYYQIEVDCQSGTENGFVQIDSIKYVALIEKSNYVTTCAAMVATPTFSPGAGEYNTQQSVTISTETPDATIYYTTDGSDPKTSGTKQTYSAAIAVSTTTTIKAIAVKGGMDDSYVAEATYTIQKELTGIAIKTAPRTAYVEGETLNVDALEVTASYTMGDPEDVAYVGNESKFTLDPTTSASLTTGNTNLRITLTENEVSQYVDQTISVYSVTLNEGTNQTYGEASRSGNLVTVSSLGEHKYVSSVTATNAEIVDNSNNTYSIINPTGNVTVTVNYSEAAQVYVHYYIGGTEVEALKQQIYQGETTTLPDGNNVNVRTEDPTYPTFYGWSETEFTAQTAEPTIVTGNPTINEEKHYYAVFTNLMVWDQKGTSAPASYASEETSATLSSISYMHKQVIKQNVSGTNYWQFKKNAGYLYNTTDMVSIKKIELTKNQFSVYECTAANTVGSKKTPTGTGPYVYTFSGDNGFFKLAEDANENTAQTRYIKVYYATGTVYYMTTFCTKYAISGASKTGVATAGGTVKSSVNEICDGREVTLSLTDPVPGYEFNDWTIKKTSDMSDVTNNVSLSENTFVMPAYDVTIVANFTQKYLLTVVRHDEAIDVKINGSIMTSRYFEAGTEIAITTTVHRGYELTSISVTGATAVENAFQMPTNAVTVEAVYTAKQDRYVDDMHDNAEIVREGGNYTVPTLEDTDGTEGYSEGCEKPHLKFVGWVATDIGVGQATAPDGLITGGTTGKYATGTTYHAVWAEQQ